MRTGGIYNSNNSISKSVLIAGVSLCLMLVSCGTPASVPTTDAGSDASVQESPAESSAEETVSEQPESSEEAEIVKGTRDNTPHVLVPEAGGVMAYEDANVSVDITNISSGYFILDYKGSNEKPKLQVTGPEGTTYTFDAHGGPETFPLTQGSGKYMIGAYEHLGDGKYAQLCAVNVDADITNEYAPYLYPNQYVNFTADSNVVALGEELAFTADDDLTVVSNVYNYLIDNVVYDTDLATNVTSGYLPDPDETIATGKGICFDYAAVMASMLRSQQIPTRLEIGYAGDAYHAWVSTYIEDIGWVNGIVEFNGTDWELMDPTLAASQGDKFLKSFIGDGNNYSKVFQY